MVEVPDIPRIPEGGKGKRREGRRGGRGEGKRSHTVRGALDGWVKEETSLGGRPSDVGFDTWRSADWQSG